MCQPACVLQQTNQHAPSMIHLLQQLWHADKKQDRNALAKPLLSILQEVEGGPIVKSKVLHLFR